MTDIRLAPLIRGLFLSATGRPLVIREGKAANGPAALSVTLDPAQSGAGLDPAAASRLLTEALAAWRLEHSAPGIEASPSAVVIHLDGETATWFAGNDIDEARIRADEGLSGILEDLPASAGRTASACARSDVVKGRVALVTGGAQGFGEEIVRGLVSSGATVFIADMNLSGAEKLAAILNRERGRTVAVPVAANVADEASVEALFAKIEQTTGGFDLCVSNAGILKAGSVLEQDLSAFRTVTDVNYTAFFIISKHSGRLLALQHATAPLWKTDIVQINSKSGLEGSNKNGAYAGGKFGGIGLVESYALELVEYGIKVNAICPGNFFDGPLWSDPEKGLFVQYLAAGKVPGALSIADVRAFYEAKVPMKRGCEGPDVMRALYYIVEQEYETGQAVPVTGGQVMLR